MVQVWFMDDDVVGDQRLEHKRSPPTYMELKELYNKTGVEYFKVIATLTKVELISPTHFVSFAQIDADDYPNDKLLNELRSTRGYTYEDEVSRCRLLEKI